MSTTIERRVGRLIEINTVGPQDHAGFGRVIALANELGPDVRAFIIADNRRAAVAPPVSMDKVKMIIKASYQRIERSATVIDPQSVHGRQVERSHGELKIEGSKVCHTPADAIAFLSPLLDAAEVTRLKQFLGV